MAQLPGIAKPSLLQMPWENDIMASSSSSKTWSKSRNSPIVVFAGVVGLIVLVFCLAMKSRQMLVPALVVDEQYLSFGEIWESPAFAWSLPIRNTTNQEIEIDGFTTSCSCAKIEPSSLTIPPQATTEVHLTLNLLTDHRGAGFKTKDFNVVVQPRITKGSGSQVGWVVHGKVKQPFAAEPQVVDFEESLVRGQSFAPRTATITCGMDVAELTAFCDSPSLTAKVTRDEKNHRRFRLEIHPQKDLASGPFNYLLRFVALTPSEQEVSGAVRVMGRVLEDVGLVPEALAFGAKPVGSKLSGTVVLRSHSGQDMVIQEIDKRGEGRISAEVGQKRKDGSRPLAVSFVVERLGHQEHTVHVKVKTRQGLLDLPLLLNCHGIPAQKKDQQ